MKIFSCFILIISSLFAQLKEELDFGNNPGNLKMFTYNHSKDSVLKPLIVVLHGCNQDAEGVAKLTGWNKLAKNNNFTILYPQQKRINNISQCFNWFLENDIDKGKGESESIFQMISNLINSKSIDSSQIFVTGLSAGGAMGVVMMSTYPETFQKGAIFAGGAYKIATNPLIALKVLSGNIQISNEKLISNINLQNSNYHGKYPKLIIFQGLNDPIVNKINADYILNQWIGVHKIDSIPDKIENNFNQIQDISVYRYFNDSNDEIITYFKIKNLGHRLLIEPGNEFDEGGEIGLFGKDIGFHSTYYLATDFGLID